MSILTGDVENMQSNSGHRVWQHNSVNTEIKDSVNFVKFVSFFV